MLYDSVASSPHTVLTNTKSVLGGTHNHVGEQALCCEVEASSYVCQPSQSYAGFMFCLHSDVYTCPCGFRCTTSELKGVPYSIHRFVALKSCTVQHLSGTCCDANISQHKRNTNVHKLPNTLLLIHVIVYVMEGER